jgi:hypothetical protein
MASPAQAQPAAAPAADAPADAQVRATPPPTSATQALDRAGAAYEFGDIGQMVELSRLVAEGALPGDDNQRADALRLLGIGLYLSGRADGAQRAFIELLKLRPRARLDPAVTRPEVVAFFEDLKRQNRPKKRLAFALLPPLGQFQNGDDGRGWVLLGLETVTLGTAVTTKILLESWKGPNLTFPGHESSAEPLKRWNYISTAAFAGVWAVGIADALIRYSHDPDEESARVAFTVLPGGGALRVSF